MRSAIRALTALCTAGLLAPALAARGQVSFTPLGSLPGAQPGSEAHDISSDGQVVVGGCPSAATCSEAWRWTEAGGMQGLGFLAGETQSVATAASADGSVVFGVSGSIFRWTSGGMVDIGAGLPGFDQVNLRGSSADGLTAVGGFVSVATLQGGVYRWTPGTGADVIEAFTIPNLVAHSDVSGDGSVIVGSQGVPDDPVPFIRTGSGKTFLPELPNDLPCQCGTEALAISEDGLVVVGESHGKPFVWTQAGGSVGLGLLPGMLGGRAQDASADGEVIVGSFVDAGSGGLFVWTAQRGLRDLRGVLEAGGVDLTGWTLRGPVAVSGDGRVIAGNGTNPSGDDEAWIAVVPPSPPPQVPALPVVALLTLAGLVAASATARRVRAAAAGRRRGPWRRRARAAAPGR